MNVLALAKHHPWINTTTDGPACDWACWRCGLAPPHTNSSDRGVVKPMLGVPHPHPPLSMFFLTFPSYTQGVQAPFSPKGPALSGAAHPPRSARRLFPTPLNLLAPPPFVALIQHCSTRCASRSLRRSDASCCASSAPYCTEAASAYLVLSLRSKPNQRDTHSAALRHLKTHTLLAPQLPWAHSTPHQHLL